MSEQTQNQDDSIFADENIQASDELTESAEDTYVNQSQPDLGAINRAKQVKTWADRIESGEADLNRLPTNLQWLKPLVEDEVNNRTKSKDVGAIVQAELARVRAEENSRAQNAKFADLRKKANSLDVDDSTKLMIEEGYKRFVAKGLSKADALEEALNTYEIVSKSGDVAVNELKKRMQVPLVTKQVKDSAPEYGTDEFINHGTAKDRVAAMEAMLKAGGLS